MSTRRSLSKRLVCVRGCGTPVYGQQQVCDNCQAKDLLCKGCGEPHGGAPATTKLCPKCRAKARCKPRSTHNPVYTPAEDKIIQDTYEAHDARKACSMLRAMWPRRPRWSITRRACYLGAATVRVKEPLWTMEEDAIMREFGWMAPERIVLKLKAKGFKRTVTAVSIRMKRMKIRTHIDGVTATGLAQLLNIDSHAVVRWISRGLLRAERSGTTGDHHDRWFITTGAIRAFLLAYPELYELSKLEKAGSKDWFFEVLNGARGLDTPLVASAGTSAPTPAPGPERVVVLFDAEVTITALAEISGRSAAVLLHRLDVLGLSVQEAAFGADVTPTEAAPAPPLVAAGAALSALMKRHKVKAADLAGWLKAPVPLVERMQAGTVPVILPAFVNAADLLDAEVEVVLHPRARSFS